MVPIALTIAGSDSGGGAGIQADLKTFSALGVYGASALAAITAQNTQGVHAVAAIEPALVAAQITAVFDDIRVDAVKIGMLANAPVIRAVAEVLHGRSCPVVLDPVMVAKSGDPLLEDEAVAALVEHLLPLATVLTPNLPEAARLLAAPRPAPSADRRQAVEAAVSDLPDRTAGIAAQGGTLSVPAPGTAQTAGAPAFPEDPAAQGAALRALGPAWVLMKGGHAEGPICTDLLIGAAPLSLSAPRQATRNTHGTGCTLSAAIAAGLAQGLDVPAAVTRAHGYLQGAIAAADGLGIGRGQGPVHHFHGIWT